MKVSLRFAAPFVLIVGGSTVEGCLGKSTDPVDCCVAEAQNLGHCRDDVMEPNCTPLLVRDCPPGVPLCRPVNAPVSVGGAQVSISDEQGDSVACRMPEIHDLGIENETDEEPECNVVGVRKQ